MFLRHVVHRAARKALPVDSSQLRHTLYLSATDRVAGAVYAVQTHDGSIVWRSPFSVRGVSVPCVGDGRVYISSSDGQVTALGTVDGALLWRQQIDQQYPTPPTAAQSLVYVSTSTGFVYALRSEDGLPVWRQHIADLVRHRPVVASERVYVSSQDGMIWALRADRGAISWQLPVEQGLLSMAATSDVVYIRTSSGTLSAWQAFDGAPIWWRSGISPGMTEPAIVDGVLYLSVLGAPHTQGVAAVRCSDGAHLWHAAAARHVIGTPAVATGFVYAQGSTNGEVNVYALRATDGVLVWQQHISATVSNGGTSGPLVIGDLACIGIGPSDGLYALRLEDGQVMWRALDGLYVTAAVAG